MPAIRVRQMQCNQDAHRWTMRDLWSWHRRVARARWRLWWKPAVAALIARLVKKLWITAAQVGREVIDSRVFARVLRRGGWKLRIEEAVKSRAVMGRSMAWVGDQEDLEIWGFNAVMKGLMGAVGRQLKPRRTHVVPTSKWEAGTRVASPSCKVMVPTGAFSELPDPTIMRLSSPICSPSPTLSLLHPRTQQTPTPAPVPTISSPRIQQLVTAAPAPTTSSSQTKRSQGAISAAVPRSPIVDWRLARGRNLRSRTAASSFATFLIPLLQIARSRVVISLAIIS